MAPMLRLLVLCLLLTLTVSAEGVKQNVRFAPGKDRATVSGAVIRGDRDLYHLGAAGGQKMTVTITSLENNAVFQVYGPNGKTLAGAGETDDATRWEGTLPKSGNYRVEVGGTRGNATYKITFVIR